MNEVIKKIFGGDKVIWAMIGCLMITSMLAVYSTSDVYANDYHLAGGYGFAFLKHAALLFLGFVVMVLTSCLQYRRYSWILTGLLVVSIPMLVYTLFYGKSINNASRVIGLLGFTFQTSDLAKVALIGYLAKTLTVDREKLDSFKSVALRVMLPVAVTVGLIFPENLSTAAMLFVVCLVMMFIGRLDMKYIMSFLGIILIIMALYIAIGLIVMKYNPDSENRIFTWVGRIETFFSNDKADKGSNYQVKQSEIAIAGGGIIGKAPGKNTQRNLLPFPYSDFIYATIIEEHGLIGGTLVLLIYLILLYRAIRIVTYSPMSFGALISIGLMFNIVMQAMVNMGVSVGILPVTGQPMPFVSMGGTSLIFIGFSFGIILSVTKDISKKNEGEQQTEPATAEADS